MPFRVERAEYAGFAPSAHCITANKVLRAQNGLQRVRSPFHTKEARHEHAKLPFRLAKFLSASLALIFASLVSGSNANAATIPYANVGHQNLTQYSFTAANSGDIVAYFLGSTAGYTETLSLLVNGVYTGVTGLPNHTSTVGQSIDFGYAAAGSTLTFRVNVQSTGDVWYSNEALNSDHINHVYSAAYTATSQAPTGIYVAFEDLRNGGDFNYFDETFVFTNVATLDLTSADGHAVPLPPTLPLLGLGLGLIGLFSKRRIT